MKKNNIYINVFGLLLVFQTQIKANHALSVKSLEEISKNIVEPTIRHAGSIVLSYFQTQLSRIDKDQKGFVTQADIASEAYIKQELTSHFPEMGIIAEESGFNNITNEYCWVIDPLDGTTNFAHGIPYFCISIALTHHGQPIFGMIYQPYTDELFYAYKEGGAFCNGRRMGVSSTPFEKSYLFIGLYYGKDESYFRTLRHIKNIAAQISSFRICGAGALDLAYIADGRADGLFLEQFEWWDVAAGTLLIEEAGGMATTYEGDPVRADFKSCVAGNPQVYFQLKTKVNQ